MTVHTRKHADEPKNLQDSRAQIAQALQDAEHKVSEIGHQSTENLALAANACNKALGGMAAACSENIDSLAETGNKVFRMAQDLGGELTQSYHRNFSALCDASAATLSCRNKEDATRLQNKLLQQTMDNYFDTASKVINIAFDSYNETLEPLNKRTSALARQFKETLAA